MTAATTRLRRAGIGSLAALVTVGGALVAVGPASAASTVTATRLAGADRYATNLAAVKANFTSASEVVVAAGTAPYDALSASAYAGTVGAPILLTNNSAAVNTAVKAEITALGATRVTVVGSSGVVSDATYTDLGGTQRLGGTDRYATSLAIAQAVGATGTLNGTPTIIIAAGTGFADALAASAPAYAGRHILLLTNGASLTTAQLAEITASGAKNAIVMGSAGVVSDAVLNQVKTTVGGTVTRVGGADRFATAAALASALVMPASSGGFGWSATTAVLANGISGWADALTGGPIAGMKKAPLLFTSNATSLPAATSTFLSTNKATVANLIILGSEAVVPASVVTAAQTAAGQGATNQVYAITPAGSQLKTVSVGGNNAGVVQYTVSGLGTTPVYVALANPANVSVTSAGVVSFLASTSTAGQADLGTPAAGQITVVNGVATGGVTLTSAAVTPTNGTVTFTVDSSTEGSALPVVYSAADGNNVIELNTTSTTAGTFAMPTEPFAVGGTVTWTPPQGALGGIPSGMISSSSVTNRYLVTGGRTYTWDANDVFQYQGVGITAAQFQSLLGTGTTVTGSYNPDPTGVSTFNIVSITTAAPTITSAATVVNADSGTFANDVQIVVTPAATDPVGTTYTLQRAAVATSTTVTPAASAFTTISATRTTDFSTGAITFTDRNLAAGNYYYRVVATYPVTGDVTSATTPASGSPVTVSAGPSAAPHSVFAAETTVGGLAGTVDAGDAITIAFDQPLNPAAVTATVQVRDADGTIANLVNGTNATFTRNAAPVVIGTTTYAANTVLTITVTAAPAAAQTVAAGTLAGLQYPLTILDQGGITGSGTGSPAWNLAGSTDKTIEG